MRKAWPAQIFLLLLQSAGSLEVPIVGHLNSVDTQKFCSWSLTPPPPTSLQLQEKRGQVHPTHIWRSSCRWLPSPRGEGKVFSAWEWDRRQWRKGQSVLSCLQKCLPMQHPHWNSHNTPLYLNFLVEGLHLPLTSVPGWGHMWSEVGVAIRQSCTYALTPKTYIPQHCVYFIYFPFLPRLKGSLASRNICSMLGWWWSDLVLGLEVSHPCIMSFYLNISPHLFI